jgi:hypothetical protein
VHVEDSTFLFATSTLDRRIPQGHAVLPLSVKQRPEGVGMKASSNKRRSTRLAQLESKLKLLEESVRTEKNAQKLKQYESALHETIEELRRERNAAQVELIKDALDGHKPS